MRKSKIAIAVLTIAVAQQSLAANGRDKEKRTDVEAKIEAAQNGTKGGHSEKLKAGQNVIEESISNAPSAAKDLEGTSVSLEAGEIQAKMLAETNHPKKADVKNTTAENIGALIEGLKKLEEKLPNDSLKAEKQTAISEAITTYKLCADMNLKLQGRLENALKNERAEILDAIEINYHVMLILSKELSGIIESSDTTIISNFKNGIVEIGKRLSMDVSDKPEIAVKSAVLVLKAVIEGKDINVTYDPSKKDEVAEFYLKMKELCKG